MTDQSRKVQLGAEFDASGVKQGTQQAKDAVRDMARDVQASAGQAGKGFEGMGTGAEGAGQKVDRVTKGIVASIERATAAAKAGEKGTAAYFESLANQRGANLATLQPYIDQLRQAERAQQAATGSLGTMGITARQTQAAMRQLPAQFTDIFTSLQAGQAPLTVLIQQGGQIKDSFGGIGPALRAVAGAISPVAVGLGALVGGTVAVAAGFVKGQAESQAYTTALVLSGNAAGATADQLQDLARSVGSVVGTQSQAAAVITQLAASGRVAASGIGQLAEAAIRLERAGGPAAQKTAEAFADLGKAPLAASLKLNESTRYLTVAVIEQIRALEDQGRTADAARVAQEAYASTAIQRAGELEERLGTLQTAWRAVGAAALSAWDAVLDIGREKTLQQKLLSLESRLTSAQRFAGGGGLLGLAAESYAGGVRGEIAATNRSLLNQTETASQRAAAALLTEEYEKARAANQRWADAALSNTDKVNKALEEHRRNVAKINEGRASAGLAALSDAEVRAQEAAIRKQFETTKQLTAAQREQQLVLESSRDAAKQWADAITDFQAIQAKAEAGADGLNEAQRRVVQLLTSQGWKQASEPARQLAIQSFVAANNALKHAEAEKQRARALAESEAGYKRYLADLDRGIDSAERQVEQLQDEFIELTRGKAARDAVVQKRLDDAAAMARQVANGALWTEGLTAETQRLIDLADAQQAVADGRRRNTEQSASNDLAADLRRQVEEGQRATDQWMGNLRNGLTDVFRQAFLAGGSFGKNFARGLAAEVQAQLATAIAQVLTGQLLSVVFGSAAGAATSGTTGGAGSWLQGASSAQSLYNLYNGGGIYGQLGRAALNSAWGSSMWYGSGAGLAAGGGAASGIGGSSAGAILGDSSGLVAANATGSGSLGASSMSWGAYAGWAALAAAVYAINDMAYSKGYTSRSFDSKLLDGISTDLQINAKVLDLLGLSDKWQQTLSGLSGLGYLFGRSAPRLDEQGVTGTIGAGDFTGQAYADIVAKGGLFRSDKRWTEFAALPDDLARFLDEASKSVYDQAQAYGVALGLPADKLASITTSVKLQLTDDAEANTKAIADALGGYGDALIEAWAGVVEPLKAYGETTAQTIARVGTAILGVNDVLRTLGLTALQAGIDGGKAAVALQDLFGGLQGLQTAAGSYLQNFYSDEERKALTRTALGDAFAGVDLTLPGTRDEYRAMVQSLVDGGALLTEAGREQVATLLSLADAFASVTPSAEELAAAAETTAAAMAQAAAAVASERQGLQVQLWQALGDTASLAAFDRSKIAPENLDIYDELQRVKAEQAAAALAEQQAQAQRQAAASTSAAWQQAAEAAAAAAQQVRQQWTEAAKTIRAEIDRLRGLGDAGGARGLGQAETAFALATAQARAGDVTAANRLPELSRAYAEAAEVVATSSSDLRVMMARIAASLAETERLALGRAAVPGFADGGSFAGGWRIVGERGPELEVTGPSRIHSFEQLMRLGGSGSVAALEPLLQGVLAQLQGMREDTAMLGPIARNTGLGATVLDEAARGKRGLKTVAAA